MNENKLYTNKQIRGKTIVSFSIFFILFAGAISGWLYLKNLPPDNGLAGGSPVPVRTVLHGNESIFDKTLGTQHLVKTYPVSAAVKTPRVNGDIGMSDDFDSAAWKLRVVRSNGDTLQLSLADIKKLPRTEIVFDFKCIEGWNQVTHWAGVKFSDFAAIYHLDKETSMKYVGMATPDLDYYVGIDMPSALHPQTLMCYEMNNKPLPLNQGYPLRMIIPVKYGIKSIKRVGTLYFNDKRPPDYWAERGYDYYSGL